MMTIRDNDAFFMARGAGSRIEIHAADAEKASWTQLDGTADAGATTITLSDATGWEVGDRIAIASTGFELEEAEERTVTGVSADGRTLTLDAPLENAHFGEVETHDTGAQTREIDMRAEVALLSRNVTIQGDAGSVEDGYGGHTMIMMGAEMHIDGAELTRMGQSGELGRYPLHWHMLGDASGQYVTNSSIHHTYNKGMTIHGTQNTWVEDNAIVETVGHSYYFEDGSEYGNVLIGNLGMNTRATESVAAGPIGSDHTAVSTYWVTNPDNHLIDNHAAGSDNVGFWILSQTGVQGASAEVAAYDGYRPNDQDPGTWTGNTSHTNGEDGLFIGGEFIEETGERTDFDPHLQRTFAMDDFTTYKNQGFGLWVRNGDGEWEDIAIADSKKGLRMWGANEVEGGVIVGRSANEEDYGFDSYHGWELYDMASVLDGVHFAGFDGADDAAIANHSGFGRNTNNAVQSLTFGDDVDRPFATRTHTSFLDGLVDADGALMGGLHDLDGSLTGQAGAVITPGIIDSRPGAQADILARAFEDIPAAGFNAAAGATWNAGGNYWLNPAGSVIGKQTFATSGDQAERVDFTITRTDNGASILYDQTTQGRNGWAQLNVDGASNGEYVVAYPDGPPPTPLEMQIRDLPLGTSVVYRFTDIPTGTVVQGADWVDGRAALDAADGTAWFRDGNGDLVLKMVADNHIGRPYDATDDLPGIGDDVYRDFARLIFEPGPDEGDTPDIAAQPAPDDVRPDAAPTAVPDRAASTSDTIDATDGLARWSDAATWAGAVPGAGDVVVIGAGQQVLLDADAEVEGIIVAGEGAALVIEDAPDTSIDLVADWILVEDGGLFQAGTEADALDTDFTLTLSGDDPDHDLDVAAHLAGEVPGTVFATAPADVPPAPVDVPPAPVDGDSGPIGEAGSVTVGQSDSDQWHQVTFDAPITDAVVVMGPVEANGGHPAVTRVRDVTETGFSFQIEEWDYKDGWHMEETIGWLALSEGVHTLSTGQTVVAGQSEIGTEVSSQTFGATLSDAIVLSEVASTNDTGAVTTRTRDVTETGFGMQLQEEEAADGIHAAETVAWIAVEAGGAAGIEAGRRADVLTDARLTIGFDAAFEAAPVLIADMQTTDGTDTAALRYDALSAGSVDLFVQEETSGDRETAHTTEVAGFLVLDEGLLYGM